MDKSTYSVESPVDYVPQRVVSLVPSITESLFDLNLGARLIGVTDYCVRPAAGVVALPKVGGTKTPDITAIIALRPDLVIMNIEENRRQDAEALQAAGIPIWATHPCSLAEAINLLWDIMNIFDDATMVPRVRQIEKVYDVVSQAARAERAIKVFVPIWRDPWMSFNTKTYIHDLLANLGVENIFANHDSRYPRITLDEVEAHKPELVLLPDEPYLFQETDGQIFSQMDIPAAQHGTIYLIDGALLTWHGTRLAYALTDLPLVIDDARTRLSDQETKNDFD